MKKKLEKNLHVGLLRRRELSLPHPHEGKQRGQPREKESEKVYPEVSQRRRFYGTKRTFIGLSRVCHALAFKIQYMHLFSRAHKLGRVRFDWTDSHSSTNNDHNNNNNNNNINDSIEKKNQKTHAVKVLRYVEGTLLIDVVNSLVEKPEEQKAFWRRVMSL